MPLQWTVAELGLDYAVGVQPHSSVWAPGMAPLAAKLWSGKGRPPKLLRRAAGHQPVATKELALSLPAAAWRQVYWREGTESRLVSRFAAVRVRPSHRDYWRERPWPELWLLVEWPRNAPEPTKYWLSNLAGDTPIERLVALAKPRWRIERNYQELKQELGLGHFEGRGWRGLHHHASLCIAAYGFLVRERATLPPTRPPLQLERPPLPESFRPRGSRAAKAAPLANLARYPASPPRRAE